MHSVLLFSALVACELDVVVIQTSGRRLVGKTNVKLEVQTTFGSASVDEDQLASIQVEKSGDVLTTVDGTVLRGTELLGLIEVHIGDTIHRIRRRSIKALHVIRRAEPKPGEITNGTAANQMTYHLRVPEDFESNEPRPAIVILHGSNSNSRAYVNTIVKTWPKVAERYILIGINGERRSSRSTPEDPAFNYSYVNFVGKSKFKGYPGTDRESPALVAEVLTELKDQLSFDRLFVGGHSQGGYLTYMMLMNYPDLIDGAFPISGGMIFQAEPRAFENEDLRQLQRRVPLAIVHGKTDPQVGFTMALDAQASLLDDAFPMVRLLSEGRARHAFALLPVDDAITWLAKMTSSDPDELLTFADEQWAAGHYRDAIAVVRRASELDTEGEFQERTNAFVERLETHVAPDAKRFSTLIRENKDGSWIDSFLEFRDQFGLSPAAREAVDAFESLREEHEEPAGKCYTEARKAFAKRNQDEGYAKYQEVIDSYYASSWYRRMKRWVDERKD